MTNLIDEIKERILKLDPDAEVEGKSGFQLRQMYRILRKASADNVSAERPYKAGARVQRGRRYCLKQMDGRFVYNNKAYKAGDSILPNEFDNIPLFEHYVKTGIFELQRRRPDGITRRSVQVPG